MLWKSRSWSKVAYWRWIALMVAGTVREHCTKISANEQKIYCASTIRAEMLRLICKNISANEPLITGHIYGK